MECIVVLLYHLFIFDKQKSGEILMLFLVVIIAISIVISSAGANASTDSLVEITDATYYSTLVATENIWLIMFYAPWCHHCKKIRPSFEKLSALSLSPKIRYGVIDATVNTESATKNNVTRFPSIMYHVPNTGSSLPLKGFYQGARTLEGLQAFAEKILAPQYSYLDGWQSASHTASSFAGINDFIFSLCVNSKLLEESPTESAAIKELRFSLQLTTKAFQSVASKHYFHSSFAILEGPNVETKEGKMFYITKVEKRLQPPDGGRTKQYIEYPFLCVERVCLEAEIENFVRYQNQPLISVLDNHNYKQFSHLDRVVIMAVVDLQTKKAVMAEEANRILTAFSSAAEVLSYENNAVKELSNYGAEVPVFGYLDGVKWRKFVKRYGGAQLPSILVVDLSRDMHKHFLLKGVATDGAELEAFILSIMQATAAGSLEMEKSESPGIIQKIAYRFSDYYPWSFIILLLPILLMSLSVGYFRYPEDKKLKRQ